jgi:hypothetical protein
MDNQVTDAQTIELAQAAGQKLLAQLELDKLNAGKSIFSYPHGLSLFLLERHRCNQGNQVAAAAAGSG